MKQTIFTALLTVGLLTGCSGVYQSVQTPDDLYYSPAKEVVKKESDQVSNKENQEYQEYVSSNEDRYLRMKAHNYDYWSSLDDYSYWNDARYSYYNASLNPYYFYNPYILGYYDSFSFGFGYGMFNNPYYFGWNPFYHSYFNNYYGGGWYNPVYIVSGYKNPVVARSSASGSNIYAFQNKTYNNSNNGSGNYFRPGAVANTNTNSFGRLVRTVFTGPSSSYNNNYSNNNNNSWSNPVRMQSSGTSTSSSAGGTSGGYASSGSSSPSGRGPRH